MDFVAGELTQRVDAVQQYESDREKNIKEASEGNAELQMIETYAMLTAMHSFALILTLSDLVQHGFFHVSR